ncbi:hypothetical protein AB0C90_03850 [Streptomyces sp. NPDC048550]|uniref:hypothetical protein n=1 Tax=unclassified Streptomyces TaxID=2593676 RepID=UPI002E0FDFB9|nr:hypothetical protein OG299_03575 [Streptomyces sp. NBC_01296]
MSAFFMPTTLTSSGCPQGDGTSGRRVVAAAPERWGGGQVRFTLKATVSTLPGSVVLAISVLPSI